MDSVIVPCRGCGLNIYYVLNVLGGYCPTCSDNIREMSDDIKPSIGGYDDVMAAQAEMADDLADNLYDTGGEA